MRCPECGIENKDKASLCKKCGRELALAPAWFPDWRWHLKTLGIIYACVTALYLAVSSLLHRLPEPYHIRKIPPEVTPWLRR